MHRIICPIPEDLNQEIQGRLPDYRVGFDQGMLESNFKQLAKAWAPNSE